MESPSVEEPASLTALEQHLAVASDPCPMCSYNLHKLKGSNCPECGFALVLRVAAMHPRMAAFYTGLIGLAAGAGFAWLILMFLIVMAMRWSGVDSSELLVVLTEAIVLSVLTGVWMFQGSRIRRMSAFRRWSLAIVAWVLSLGALAVFTTLYL